ncbi:MAG TPA: threonine aldolase family protein [Acetobacteraceae bacterium]|jgi:threonine aldolase|nr:threonine aldolase family protein [Acetobacteraceae bacterium]
MVIDLRSDTVSRPTAEMRRAMADAEVGDDQYGDDPTVNRLQRRVAELLGKEDAVFVPSGTMANQVALRLVTQPGDEVVVSRESHATWHELGGGAANSGVQFLEIGGPGGFTADEFRRAIKPRNHVVFPPTTLVEVENTHNRAGGIVADQAEVEAICRVAGETGIATFLDGARLFNAAVASGRSLEDLARPFDLVAVALSKGLGCPVGSLLVGQRDIMDVARRQRRMLGGGMRQAGILAAAGLYALEHHLRRLAEDHANARLIAEWLAASGAVTIDLATVQTNIVVCHFAGAAEEAPRIVRDCAARGVLVSHFGGTKFRLTTHLDVDTAACRTAAAVTAEVMEGVRA